VLSDVLRRDVRDSTRENSPLRVADGAVYVDTTTLSVGEVVEAILRLLPGGVH
jgi:cytidylate kinase